METEHISPRRSNRLSKGWWAVVVIICLLVLCATVLVLKIMHAGSIIPASVSKQLSFPVYLPQQLPGTYTLAPGSFAVHTDGQAKILAFKATDATKGTILFTEQPKPEKLNFTEFYKTQLTDAKTLNDVPFPSVWGKDAEKQQVTLSIVTDTTWILITSDSPLDEASMVRIAQSLKQN
jgi:hypothetical protein